MITGSPTPTRNVLCVSDLSSAGDSNHRCHTKLEGSVGMEGWRISCWPFDSQFTWSADSTQLGITETASLRANDWESVRVAVVNASDFAALPSPGGPVSFQPIFSPSGRWLAFTQAPTPSSTSYTWAQQWQVCIHDTKAKSTQCDQHGTLDEMPTLVGWSGNNVICE